ncbi:hypothetical protein Poli38472_014084 [Pythium oligandrum]|uniref:ATP synthase mitochondrial F1 complex assembly factor 1 n=1 Tax=Pythium oligandrum TaxID=41045 RepID=A0A8K1CNF2_PYTOL|nr:hypothetical protein Poli38472_014084 [Pythium oligandrum]|eukprot:TMW66772.1 hypothetical protein Poli38472_014084 [Pythium oligandrum]
MFITRRFLTELLVNRINRPSRVLIRASMSPLAASLRRALAPRALLRSRWLSTEGKGPSGGGFSFPAPQTLQQIVKLDLLVNEEPTQIRRIWEDYHSEKDDAIARVLDGTEYSTLMERARSAPYFIFPVYRQGGFFNMLCQFQDKCFLVTYLEAFKENPALAPPCVTVSLFDDLLAEKDVGLLRADVVNMLDKAETEKLLNQLLRSYSNEKLYDWVDKFNNRPNEFDFDAFRHAIDNE